MVAACFPVSKPFPDGSTPYIFTDLSSKNGVNNPAALLPPPTQATKLSGFLPNFS